MIDFLVLAVVGGAWLLYRHLRTPSPPPTPESREYEATFKPKGWK